MCCSFNRPRCHRAVVPDAGLPPGACVAVGAVFLFLCMLVLMSLLVSQNFTVWTADCPAVEKDPSLGFAKCVVVGKSADGTKLVLEQVDPPGTGTFEVLEAEVFNANALLDPAQIDDIGYMPHTNVPCVLSLLKERFMQGLIYTTAVPLLVAVNPFKDLGNATDAWIRKYRDSSKPELLPPHVFKTARTALEDLEGYKKNQAIIVSGESGAGKTEATKQIMRYFASASGAGDTRVQDTIMAGNPLLEAFGNAKTIRNNNSSRFGRFMMLEVSTDAGIQHGTVSNFLLEKVRVVSQEAQERSYHIFYQLIKGATDEMRRKYRLLSLRDYVYLNAHSGGCYDVPGIDDKKDFADVLASLDAIQVHGETRDSVFSILSGLLLVGNIQVQAQASQGVPDAAFLSPRDLGILEEASQLMRVDEAKLRRTLLVKETRVGAQVIEGLRTKEEAATSICSLSKNVYDKLFDWLVKQLNSLITSPTGISEFIGILDIFGFEVLEVNSLEQALINITNEYLQKHFVDVVFELETKLYQEEGVPTSALEYTDNLALVSTLCGKQESFFALLEDACLGLKSTDEVGVMTASMAPTTTVRVTPERTLLVILFLQRISLTDVSIRGSVQTCSAGDSPRVPLYAVHRTEACLSHCGRGNSGRAFRASRMCISV